MAEVRSSLSGETSTAGYLSAALESVPVGVPLPYAVHLQIGGKLLRFRSTGDELSLERVQKLAEQGVDTFYVEQVEWTKYLNSLESSLDERGLAAGNEEAAIGLRNILGAYIRTIEDKREATKEVFEKLVALSAKLPGAIGQSRELAHKLLRRYKDASMYFANHAVNVAIYSTAVGLKLRISESELKDLALAATFANIGIIKVAPEILYKPGPLTPEEWKVVRQHPKYGMEILKSLLAKPRICEAVAHHHERFDGKGYPSGITGQEIQLFARVITIGETYSALTSNRPWQPAHSPHEAVSLMQGLVGKFDPSLFGMVVR